MVKPILLKGHERSITQVKYNREGDLLLSCAKDNKPTVWSSETGERIGTYDGHNGAVWSVDFNSTTTSILSGSADNSARLWDAHSGVCSCVYEHQAPVRVVSFAEGDRMFLTAGNIALGEPSAVFIYNITKNPRDKTLPVRTITGHKGKISGAFWAPLNAAIITAGEDATVRMWDSETGKEVKSVTAHKSQINSIQASHDGTMFVTASADMSAKLYDARSFQLLKTFVTDRELNAAAINPTVPHVLVGGGQEAAQVTTTLSKAGKFEVLFYHLIYERLLGQMKGHFGPVNTLAIHPSGGSFATGGEDGYVRVHHLGNEYVSSHLKTEQ